MFFNKEKIKFFRQNWKLSVHLLLRTKYFGVNNQWRSSFPSIFGWPWWKIFLSVITIYPIILNYRRTKWRAKHVHFLHPTIIETLGWNKK